jgi:hypothetical protein
MNNLKSTVGFVGSEGVMLKDQSVFEKGEVVIVLSVDNFDEIFRELKAFKDDLEKSKEWIDEIKEIKENIIK